MVIEVVSQGSFDSSHQLKDHPGKCKNIHGHTWKYEVRIKGYIDEKTGMVIDFGLIDDVISKLDHQHINEILDWDNPTSERVAVWIKMRLWELVGIINPDNIKNIEVTLWESPRHYVIV